MSVLIVNRLKPEADMDELKRILPHHIAWLKEMLSDGCVLQAGKWGSIGGITFVAGDSIDEAEHLVKEDPLVKSGLVTIESGIFLPISGQS